MKSQGRLFTADSSHWRSHMVMKYKTGQQDMYVHVGKVVEMQ